ncbi:MAG: protoglobin domain-containing protein [Myxococcota bacterium]
MKDLSVRLEYLKLDDHEVERLRRLEPVLEKHADDFVAAFYRHLLAFGETRALLSDPLVKERLLGKQREYLLSLSHPRFDKEWEEDRRRIGRVHQRIGLEPRWYLGAYALYFSLLVPIICESFAGDGQEESARIVTALQRLLMFDAQLAMEEYITASEERLEYLTEELSEQSRSLSRKYDDQSETLRRTTIQARAAEELASIATLIAGLAHEIGTPMGVIQGHAKRLEAEVTGEDATWRLQTIQEQIGRISRIIQVLLNMARPRPSRRQPLLLGPLVERTLSFVSEKLARRHIEVVKSIDDVASVSGDPERLQQLLLNLFLNAADAMPDGGELRVTLCEKDGGAEITVADTGTGIRPQDLSQIFDPFFTTKPAGEGNGLGLMVCKGIVGDHGGVIEAASEEGDGTEFRVHLPLAS